MNLINWLKINRFKFTMIITDAKTTHTFAPRNLLLHTSTTCQRPLSTLNFIFWTEKHFSSLTFPSAETLICAFTTFRLKYFYHHLKVLSELQYIHSSLTHPFRAVPVTHRVLQWQHHHLLQQLPDLLKVSPPRCDSKHTVSEMFNVWFNVLCISVTSFLFYSRGFLRIKLQPLPWSWTSAGAATAESA